MCLNHLLVPAAQFPRGTVRVPYQVCCESLLESWSHPRPSWLMSAVQGLRKSALAAGSLLTVWWKMWSLGLRLQQPIAFQLWLLLACLSDSREGGPYMQPACPPLVFIKFFVLYSKAFIGYLLRNLF